MFHLCGMQEVSRIGFFSVEMRLNKKRKVQLTIFYHLYREIQMCYGYYLAIKVM